MVRTINFVLLILLLVINAGYIFPDIYCNAEAPTNQQTNTQSKCININGFVFKGNSSFSDLRLKIRMKSWHSSFLPGDLNCYNEDWLKKDILSIIQFYRKNGFPDVEIDHILKKNSKNENIVEITVDEGFQYEIAFKGNTFFSNRELEKLVDLVKKGNVNDTALSKAKVDIKTLYLDAGFQDILVEFSKNRIVRTPKKLKTSTTPKTSEISEILKTSTTPKASDTPKNFENESQKSSELIDKKTERTIWAVEFSISEGTRYVVNLLTIQGNKRISKNEILDSMLTRQNGRVGKWGNRGYNSNVLNKDINAIELLYLGKGFLNAKITKKIAINTERKDSSDKSKQTAKHQKTTESQTNRQPLNPIEPQIQSESQIKPELQIKYEPQLVDIQIDINEGVQTIVKSTVIKGLYFEEDAIYSLGNKDILTPEKALEKLSLRQGEPFREYMVKSDENALSMMISELGYPHVKVKSEITLKSDKSEASLVWRIEQGKFTRFGNISYFGNRRLKEDVIKKRMKIETGKPFSLKQVLATEKSLRESSAVKYVQITSPELSNMAESPDIEVLLEENKPYFFEAALGYDTEQRFYIDTKVGDNNFLGREIDAWVTANISGIGYGLESGVKKPFFFGTEIDATGIIYVEDKEELNKNFGIRSWGYESSLSRHLFVKNLITGLSLKYENRTVYGDAEIDVEEQETRNILVTSFSVGYDSRDSSVRPVKGFLSTASVDVYNGFDNDFDRFFKYQIDLRKYITPFNKVTFALRTRMGYIQPFDSQKIVAYDQLFFLGGAPNVRGFKENMLEYDDNGDPSGGRSAVNSTFEARIDLPADFELNLFLDTGKIDNLTSKTDLANSLESRGFRSSVGAGLRYITPIGPVGILYGYKLDAEDRESQGRIHFSVGYTF